MAGRRKGSVKVDFSDLDSSLFKQPSINISLVYITATLLEAEGLNIEGKRGFGDRSERSKA